MKISAFLISLVPTITFGYTFNVQKYNETLISVNKAVLGVNCTPNSKGLITSVPGIQNTSQNYFLKLIPKGKDGKLYCSFKLSNKELIDVTFNLGDYLQTPVVDIVREEKIEINDDLLKFVEFSRGGLKGLKRTSSKSSKNIKTKQNSYRINNIYVGPKGNYYYEITLKKVVTDHFFKLKKTSPNTIKYSSLINKDKQSKLYLESFKDLNLKEVLL